MLILISCIIFFVTSVTLVILRITRPEARYPWLIAIGGAFLALISVFIWLAQIPSTLTLLTWQPVSLFVNPILFRADGLSWPYALSLSTLTLAVLLTAVTRPAFTNSYSWAGTLALGGLGLMAVTANNPLTLLLVWAALDITELIIQLRSVDGPLNNEKVIVSFSSNALGIGVLLWANIVSISSGNSFDFSSITPQAGLYFVVAAGLRLGVLSMRLPYSAESNLRRGFGTSLRLVSAASSLALLSHVPTGSLNAVFALILNILVLSTAIYAGWMWLRAPDELSGRPYWIIGVAALAIESSLNGNLAGTIGWGCALILAGGALFLASIQQIWLNRAMLISAFCLSSLPFSLTATTWAGQFVLQVPFMLVAQSLLITGYIRHTLRPGGRDSLDSQPNWTRTVYPAGVGILVLVEIILGFVGWDGARQTGTWIYAFAASLLTLGLIWATPRFRILNPIRAHWVDAASSSIQRIYNSLWGIYDWIKQLSDVINSTLEGNSGIMWTLLFLVLFVSFMIQGER